MKETDHVMKLNPSPFEMIRTGKKTIELRLYDEKRQRISVGDTVTFINTAAPSDTLRVRVEALHIFASFDELYEALPLLECGYTEENVGAASPRDMEAYYSKEQQRQYGVVGIKITLL